MEDREDPGCCDSVRGGARQVRGQRGQALLLSEPGEAMGGVRRVRARAGLGAEGLTRPQQEEAGREGEGPWEGVAVSRGLTASLLLLPQNVPKGHGPGP